MKSNTSWTVICDTELVHVEEPRKVVTETDKVLVFADKTKYHKYNSLNNLTSREWLTFQKSWFVLNPKRRTEDVLLHPAKFPEELVQSFVEFFTKKGQLVLDPMLGTGSTLVACAAAGRSGIGIELLEKYARIAKERVETLAARRPLPLGETTTISLKVILADAGSLDQMGLPPIDYCITSPPYWDMLRRKGFETQRNRQQRGLDVAYSDDPRDLGNIQDYAVFLDELTKVYEQVYRLLKRRGYLTLIVKNIKKGGRLYPLAWDLAARLQQFLVLKDERIWCQNDIKLAPFGYGRAWVSNTVHHYCLNFRKEE